MTNQETIREDAIVGSFLENDRIWPPSITSTRGHPFVIALVEVLKRLPDDAYYDVENYVSFVIEDSRFMAFNVPFKRIYPTPPNGLEVRFDTIVIFHHALRYPSAALVGLIAHELAHSFGNHQEYKADEEAADVLVRQWGFDEELEALQVEQKKLMQISSNT